MTLLLFGDQLRPHFHAGHDEIVLIESARPNVTARSSSERG